MPTLIELFDRYRWLFRDQVRAEFVGPPFPFGLDQAYLELTERLRRLDARRPRWIPIDEITDDLGGEDAICLTLKHVGGSSVLVSTRNGGPSYWRGADADYVLPLVPFLVDLPPAPAERESEVGHG